MVKSTASDDAFVKKVQMATAGMAGKDPKRPKEMEGFNGYMSNNGEHAQDLASYLARSIDKKAFPVK